MEDCLLSSKSLQTLLLLHKRVLLLVLRLSLVLLDLIRILSAFYILLVIYLDKRIITNNSLLRSFIEFQAKH